MSWRLDAVWPILDPTLSYEEAVAQGELELPDVSYRSRLRIVGEPRWAIRECDPDREWWPGTPTALTLSVPAIPAQLQPEDLTAAIRLLASLHWTDGRIAAAVDRAAYTVRDIRRQNHIPAGVPQGYHDISEVAEPKDWRRRPITTEQAPTSGQKAA
jgi:hypothetical protein